MEKMDWKPFLTIEKCEFQCNRRVMQVERMNDNICFGASKHEKNLDGISKKSEKIYCNEF